MRGPLNLRPNEVLKRAATGTSQDDRTMGEYFKEAGAEWVELLFLRDEASQGKPQHYWQTSESQNEGFDLLNALRQAAVDEEITFRGRRFDYERPEIIAETVPLTKIPAAHFEENGFMLGRFLGAKNNYDTFTGGAQESVEAGLYRDVRAKREQLEEWYRRWRKKRKHR
jgi:hypothetical protein